MVSDHRFDRIWKIDRLQDVRADCRVDLHSFEFSRRQWAGLVQNVFRNRQFACVMKQGSRL